MLLPPTLSALIQGLLFPPGLLLAGTVVGAIFALLGRRRIAFAIFAAPVALTLVLATPLVSRWIVEPLEQRAYAMAQNAQAAGPLPRTAVVLGGALDIALPDARAAETSYDLYDAADRVVAAARLFREGKVDRVVLAGGRDDDVSEAELMARFAVDLGVPRAALVLEGTSRSTRENARNVAEVLRDNHLGHDIALVTSGMHIRRAMMEFRCAGLAPVAAPADYEVLGSAIKLPEDLIPKLRSIDRARRGIKEWMGAMIGGCG